MSILKNNTRIEQLESRSEIVSLCQNIIDIYKLKYGNSIRFDVISIPNLQTDIVFYLFKNRQKENLKFNTLDLETKKLVDKYWNFWHENIGKIFENYDKKDIDRDLIKLGEKLRVFILADKELIKSIYDKDLELNYRKKIAFLWGFCIESQADFKEIIKAAEIELNNRMDFTVLNEFAKSFIKHRNFAVPIKFLSSMILAPSIPLIEKILFILKDKPDLLQNRSIISRIKIVYELQFPQISYFKKYFQKFANKKVQKFI